MSSRNQPPCEHQHPGNGRPGNKASGDEDGLLEQLLNLGPKSVDWLKNAGIDNEASLKSVGPAVAYQIVCRQQHGVSRNFLWALYGAIHDVDWRDLTSATKAALLAEIDE